MPYYTTIFFYFPHFLYCFLKKEGSFLPQCHPYFQPAYQVEGDKKRTYFELAQFADADQERLTEYALDIINS